MELIEIIVNVLKIFTLCSIVLLALSYLFFKVKDRTRIKPYMLLDTEAEMLVASEPVVYELPVRNETEDPLRYRKLSKRFEVINEERQAAQGTSNYGAFYKPVVRENVLSNYMSEAPALQPLRSAENQNNIYNLYSPGSEQMHKIGISGGAR